MPGIPELVEQLCARDTRAGYAALCALREKSAQDAQVYAYFDRFAAMMDDKNAFVRTRGLLLLADNAVWDAENRLDAVMERFCRTFSTKSRRCRVS